jgi:hypothetical protein
VLHGKTPNVHYASDRQGVGGDAPRKQGRRQSSFLGISGTLLEGASTTDQRPSRKEYCHEKLRASLIWIIDVHHNYQ